MSSSRRFARFRGALLGAAAIAIGWPAAAGVVGQDATASFVERNAQGVLIPIVRDRGVSIYFTPPSDALSAVALLRRRRGSTTDPG